MVVAGLMTVWVGGGWVGDAGKADRSVCGAGSRERSIVGCKERGEVHERIVIEGAANAYSVWLRWQAARWRAGGVFGGWSGWSCGR